MKLLWVGDFAFTGYFTVALRLIPQLKTYFNNIYFLAINNPDKSVVLALHKTIGVPIGNIFLVPGVQKIVDEQSKQQQFGVFALPNIVNKLNPNVVFCMNDLQVCLMYIKALKLVSPSWKGKSIAYVPIDARSVPKFVFEGMEQFDMVLSITPNSVKEFKNAGIPCKLLEHPNAPDVCMEDTVKWRKKLGIPANHFVFLNIAYVNIAAKKGRKRIDICLNSFTLYCKHQQNGHLILKTSADLQNLQKFYSSMLLPINPFVRSRIHILTCKLSKRDLCSLIWASDVMLSTTSGEGWGFPVFEAMQMGKFCIVPDNTSFSEYCPKPFLVPADPEFVLVSRKVPNNKAKDFVVLYAKMDYVHPGVVACLPSLLLAEKKEKCQIINIDLLEESLIDQMARCSNLKEFIFISQDVSNTSIEPEMLKNVLPFHKVFITSGINLCTTGIVSKENVCEKMLHYTRNKAVCDALAKTAGPSVTRPLSAKNIANRLITMISSLFH